jgi:hypothetical protein
MRLDLPAAQVGPAWELLLAECARRGVLLRRGGLNNVTYSHTVADIDHTVAVCADAFRALRDAGFGGPAAASPPERELAAATAGRGQQMGLS